MANILIGHASIDENGKSTGGTAGDQTGKEVCTRTWYSKPWDYMAIHPTASVREKHAAAVEAACANSKIGYDQGQRNTLNTYAAKVSYDLSKITTACECDCSSLQNVCAIASGAATSASYGSNGWTTSNMLSKLINLGYIIIAKNTSITGYSSLNSTQKKSVITSSTYLTSSAYCVRGAIYVKAGSHTVCGLTNGASYAITLKAAGLTTSTSSSSTTTTNTSTKKTATEAAKSYNKSYDATYKVTASSLNVRNGAGTSKSVMVAIPKGTSVKCYGYYTTVNNVKWLYIQFTYKSVTYTGFASSQYLAK